jgi:hypothetical protein
MNKKNYLLLVIVAVSALLSGCVATGAKSTAMSIALPVVEKQHPESVSITVSGGKATNPLWTSQVSNEEFQAALIESISASRVFSAILPTGQGDLVLEVTLLKLEQPLMGLNMTVTAETEWVLKNRLDGAVQWQKQIAQPYTATMSDAMVGVTRLRMASEGAIKLVIKSGVEEISRIRFK